MSHYLKSGDDNQATRRLQDYYHRNGEDNYLRKQFKDIRHRGNISALPSEHDDQMTSTQEKGISSERIHGSTSVNVDYLECSICHDLLWKPIACKKCETPFCSICMDRWLAIGLITCPTRCETYIERKCPPFITKVLSRLQIICFYQTNGCQEILPYEALDKHEISCGYQFTKCPGCQLEVLKRDFPNHKESCELFPMTCEDCKFIYKRNEATTKHTEAICL
ncbi:unnamed protein product, partial [Adineta steineri]